MRAESEIRKEFEYFREKLNDEVEKSNGMLDNENVVLISKKMDELLNEISPYIENREHLLNKKD